MRFDAIVIGSGQGGNPLAYALADHGWIVAMVEQANLGGTCVNTGCTPTKTMIMSAQVAHYARESSRWGVRAGGVSVDMAAVVARKNEVVLGFRSGHERRVAQRPNLHLYRGHGRFVAPRKLQVDDDLIEGERVFINVGTRPHPPRVPGLETVAYLTNESIMELQEVPDHLMVLGGGYVGLEFAQMFRRFGSRVTLIHNTDQILAREDPEISRELQKSLEAEGVTFYLSANTTKVEKQGDQISVTIALGQTTQTIAGTHILAATGRRPNTDDLGVDKAGLTLGARGYIQVNGRMETGVPGMWALGDVKGGPAFTHISYNDFQILYANIVDGKDLSIENRYVPYSLFTDPQLGRVGMTEKEARATGRKLKIGTHPMANVSRAIERSETAGLMKIVIDASSDQILGAAILGIEGGETVQILGAMMMADAPWTILKGAVYIHPTLAEGFFGLMDSVRPID
jgi:pyruvate/2-oxoglutarate dehydrogenase complex dihydrolipoamide dehydrogenase (E3) component